MVHLSRGIGDAVNAGRVRTPEPIILEVDARAAADDGLVIQKAGRTVFLATDIPPKYLTKIEVDLNEFPLERPAVEKKPEEDEDKPVVQELPPDE
jgi:RNA:NAD 2'-phosphotransferase (TPT1/KptA family)